ncbi:hypothetical protein OY671_000125 [Metschnikowia pulcherrima]|nr:hypothetical protein OY671_000125 [Metschnikowia pulcherrima]
MTHTVDESPGKMKRKPPSESAGHVRSMDHDTNTTKGAKTTLLDPGKVSDAATTKEKCFYLINHEFRALQLDKSIATMSVFDLIDHCAALFEQSAAKSGENDGEAFRLYARSFLIFNYFVNTFIMLHFNGFARFMESSHQDFIIYLNLYNFYKRDDILPPGAFRVSPETVRDWVVEYLVEKRLLTFDVALLYAWLDEYIEYLKNKEMSADTEPACENEHADSIGDGFGDIGKSAASVSNPEDASEDDMFDFNTRFPELSISLTDRSLHPEKLLRSANADTSPSSRSPNTRHHVPPSGILEKAPYPISDNMQETTPLPYPAENATVGGTAYVMTRPRVPLPTEPYKPQLKPTHAPEMAHLGRSRDPQFPSNGSTSYYMPEMAPVLDQRMGPGSGLHTGVTKYPTESYDAAYQGFQGHPMHAGTRQPDSHGNHSRRAMAAPQSYASHKEYPSNAPYGFERAATSNGTPHVPSNAHHHPSQRNTPNWPSGSNGSSQNHKSANYTSRQGFAICGLKNMGSSCYINSTVQVLVGLETFEASLLNRKKRSGSQPLTEATAGLITTFNANSGVNIAPTKFLRVLSHLKPDFNVPFEQQDAQEFLLFLLDKLHEEMAGSPRDAPIDYLSKWNITVNSRDRDEYLKWYKDLLNHEGESPINDTFQGHVQSKLVCNQCGHRSVSYSSFTILSLPIPAGNNQTVDLTDCLRYYTQDEVLTGENAWNCPICNKSTQKENPMDVVFQPKRGLFRLKRSKSPAKKASASAANAPTSISIKQLSFIKLPPVMFIHLSRFSMMSVTDKLNTNITYPLRLKFNHQDHDIYYNLTGLINHYGTLKSGHYTSLVNKAKLHGRMDSLSDPVWCFFDDDSVRINVPHGEVHSPDYGKLHSRDVYVLCYERV